MSGWQARGCEIRAATREDVGFVHGLEVDIFGPDAWSTVALVAELPPVALDEPLRRHGVVTAVGGRVVGYALSRLSDQVCDIFRVAVSPAHRRLGLGTALVEALLDKAREQGCTRALLEVADGNTPALECYARLGFGTLDRRARYYASGGDALVLQKLL